MKVKHHILFTLAVILSAVLLTLLFTGCEVGFQAPAGPVAATCFKPCECSGKCCKTRTGDIGDVAPAAAKGQFVPRQNEILPLSPK